MYGGQRHRDKPDKSDANGEKVAQMIRQLMKTRRKQVLIDINTQRDFFVDGGTAVLVIAEGF